MAHIIDVRGLPDEQVKLIEEFVRFLKVNAKKTVMAPEPEGDIIFGEWPLESKGTLAREEIYDYL